MPEKMLQYPRTFESLIPALRTLGPPTKLFCHIILKSPSATVCLRPSHAVKQRCLLN